MARQCSYGSREGSLESEVCFSSSPEVVSNILPFQEGFGLKLGLDAAGLLTSVPMDHYPQHDMSENQEWLSSLRSRSWQEANSCSEYLTHLEHYNYNCASEQPLDMYGGISGSACSSFNLAVAGTAANSFTAMQVSGFNTPEEYHFMGMSPQQFEQHNSSFHLISEFKANQAIPEHSFDQAFPHYLTTNAAADTAAATGYQDPFLAAFSNSAGNCTATNNIASCIDLSSKGSHKKLDKVANDHSTKSKDRNTSGYSHLQPQDKSSKRPANKKEAKASSSDVSTESGSKSSVIDSCVEKPKKRLQEEHPEQQVISNKRVHLEAMQPVKNSTAAVSPSASTKLLQPIPIAAKVSSSSYYSYTPTKATRTPALNTNLKPRARQGSANDPQSIAARHRRERISDRLKILQDLVPNSAKVDLVTMLEKAINYVKFLQLQVKVLTADEYWPDHKSRTSTHEAPVEESALMVPVQHY